MSRTRDHYETLLAAHYSWMHGDFETRRAAAAAWFRTHGIVGSARALDLGAGAGCHALALAELGFAVRAIDFSETLIDELRGRAVDAPIEAVVADFTDVASWGRGPRELVVCMGDTLTHLASAADVRALFASARAHLVSGGQLVIEYRDLGVERSGVDRFVPVRSDANRILTCFLEYGPERVEVHDLLYVRDGEGWTLTRSAYPKLRLASGDVCRWLEEVGFTIAHRSDERGLTRIVARNGLTKERAS